MDELITFLKAALPYDEFGRAYIINENEFIWAVEKCNSYLANILTNCYLYSHGAIVITWTSRNVVSACGNKDILVIADVSDCINIYDRSKNNCYLLTNDDCTDYGNIKKVYISRDNAYIYLITKIPKNKYSYSIYFLHLFNVSFGYTYKYIKECEKTCIDEYYADSRILLSHFFITYTPPHVDS